MRMTDCLIDTSTTIMHIQDYNFLFLNLVKGSQNNLSSEKDDFSDLPPNQRRKRLQQKIDELNSKVRHKFT